MRACVRACVRVFCVLCVACCAYLSHSGWDHGDEEVKEARTELDGTLDTRIRIRRFLRFSDDLFVQPPRSPHVQESCEKRGREGERERGRKGERERGREGEKREGRKERKGKKED